MLYRVEVIPGGVKLEKATVLTTCMCSGTMHTILRVGERTLGAKHTSDGEPPGWYSSVEKAKQAAIVQANQKAEEYRALVQYHTGCIDRIQELEEAPNE